MRNNFITLFFLAFAFSIQAQDINPFESIGKQGKMLTLSNGKYKEIHADNSLQQIGSVIINMNTGKIYEFIEFDTLYSEATLDPTVISRFYSIDPLTGKYPQLTPYQFCSNSPIYMIELEGLEGVIAIPNSGGVPALTFNGDSPNQNEIMFAFLNVVGGVNAITRQLTPRELGLVQITNGRTAAANALVPRTGGGINQVSPAGIGQFINMTFTPITGSASLSGWNTPQPIMDPANTTSTSVQGDFGATPSASSTFNFPIAGGASNFDFSYGSQGPNLNTFILSDNLGNVYPMPSSTNINNANNVLGTVLPGVTSFNVTVGGGANNVNDQFNFTLSSNGTNTTATNITPTNNTTSIPVGGGNISITTTTTTGVQVQQNVTSTATNPLNKN